jgi:hypothetical protein
MYRFAFKSQSCGKHLAGCFARPVHSGLWLWQSQHSKPAVCFDCSAYFSRKLEKAQTNTVMWLASIGALNCLYVFWKHQAFLFFHSRWPARQTSVSNHFLSPPWTLPRSLSHHSSSVMCVEGISKLAASSCLHRSQTSLAKTHCMSKCSTVSSSYRHTK